MTSPFITTSDLLVQEDQDFVNNFVLTEEALARCEELVREREKSKSKSTLADVLLFSGSVAAVAGAAANGTDFTLSLNPANGPGRKMLS